MDWDTDFYDNHHCNAGGSIKLTDYFTDYLVETYSLEASNASPRVKKQFQKDILHFHQALEKYGFE